MDYLESKKKLDEIRNRNHEVVFRMAISHLMDVGIRHLDGEISRELVRKSKEKMITGLL